MLPQFTKTESSIKLIEPVYKNLYEIAFKTNIEPTSPALSTIQDNIAKYELHKSNIVMKLVFGDTSIKDVCAFFDGITETSIMIHNPQGSIIRRVVLEMSENCLEDFCLCQDWDAHDELVTFDVTLKYKEITSEILS